MESKYIFLLKEKSLIICIVTFFSIPKCLYGDQIYDQSKNVEHSQSKKEEIDINNSIDDEPTEDISRLFLRESEVLLKPRETQISIGFDYSKNDSTQNLRFTRNRMISIPISISVGILENMEIFSEIPYVYIGNEIVSFDRSLKQESHGVGDLSLGFSYRLLPENKGHPSITSSFTVVAPTGEDGSSEVNAITSGVGFWGVSTGLSVTKSVDPAVLFFTLGYAHSFEEDGIKNGDSFNYGFGMGLSINSLLSVSGRFSGTYIDEITVGGVKIPGSSTEPVSFNIDMTYQLNNTHRIASSIGFGLNDDVNDTSISFSYIINL